MKTAIVNLKDITGGGDTFPDRKIVREAQKNFCLSAEFWTRIKSGKIPYIFDRNNNNLVEASYTDTIAELKKYKSTVEGSATNVKTTYRENDIYWLTDAEYPEVNETLQNIASIDTMKKSYHEKISKYTK